MSCKKLSALAIFILGFHSLYAWTPIPVNTKNWHFVVNKGQLPSSEIKYYSHQGGVYLYCRPGMISFVFTKVENNPTVSEATGFRVETQCLRLNRASAMPQLKDAGTFNASLQRQTIASRADLVLLNSNPSAQIIASDKQEYYENYYTTGDANDGITNVHTYKTIVYKDIYPHIDMVLHAKEQGMEYEFVVNPGGNVDDIQIQWNGLQNIYMSENGGISYASPLGTITESAPYSYVRAGLAPALFPNSPALCDVNTNPGINDEVSAEKGDRKDRPYKIPSHFVLKNNRIRFNIGKYDKTKTLVIDPTLIWATYYGGAEVDDGQGVATDGPGNVYITGTTQSISAIATFGAYQASFGGGVANAFLAKFNSIGQIQWATYFGGNGGEGGGYVATDGSGNVFISGYTESTSGIATFGAYQTSLAGQGNDFLAKFSNGGILHWATYFGGNGSEGGGYVATDGSGNVFISGYTTSTSGIATQGAYQTSYADSIDAFLAKFNGSGAIQWATYFGGSGSDVGCHIAIDAYGSVYMTGSTFSRSGIATAGAYQPYYGGNQDAFLAKFNGNGLMQWATYYGGNQADGGLCVTMDLSGNVYMSGYTGSTSGIATNGAYQTSFAGGSSDVLLAKFNSLGKIQWATYYGSSADEWGEGILKDRLGNIFLAGFSSSPYGMATAGAYRTYSTGFDAFLADFDTTGAIHWATYYGSAGYDEAYGVAADDFGNVYIAGFTTSTTGIATTGACQTYYGGGVSDAFLAKFGNTPLHDAGIDSFISPKGSGCIDTLPAVVRLKNYGLAELDSVTIFFSLNGKIRAPYYWTGKLLTDSSVAVNLGNFVFSSGPNTLKGWTYNPNGVLDSFPQNDTAFVFININPLPTANAGPDTILCYDQTYTMQGSGGISYTWRPATYLSSATNPNAIAVLPNTEQYVLVVSNGNGCTDSADVLLKVRPKLVVKAISNHSSVCYGQMVVLSAKGQGGDSLHYQYQWGNDSLTGDSVTKKIYQNGWHTVVLSDNCTPDPARDSVYVTVIPQAKAAFTWSPIQNNIQNHNVSFINQSTNASSYLWTFGTNDSSKAISPVYIYTDTGDYQVTLVAYGLNNCPNDTAFGFIELISDQVTIYIPNAFSPNGDGINDVFDISGVGINGYSYNIYNRWGEHVFGGTSGWDGNFKGTPVPEGVYMYQLDVTDVEGQHHYLSGNVTLMR